MSWQKLAEILPPPPQKILIVACRSSQIWAEKLRCEHLQRYDVEILADVGADPCIASVQSALEIVISTRPDWIVAIGGGSVIDTAKAAAVLANNPGNLVDYIRGSLQITAIGIPLIVLPTTAGSGSEVTPYASITDAERMQKISLTHEYLYPRFALLDPTLALSSPSKQFAISGMDALCHAIEGYWSNRATPVTDAYALFAARLILSKLPEANTYPENLPALKLMLQGSLLAGLTISNARTTAVHAVSYPMTVHFGVPHGLACSMTLSSFIRYNAGALGGDKERCFLDSLGLESMDQLADAVDGIKKDLELPLTLRELGLKETDIQTIIDNGFRPDRMSNNPRPVSVGELRGLLEEVY